MIGVKYCGGCNPHYDRIKFYEDVKAHYNGRKEFELARDGVEYEGLLVLGGCVNCCAAYEHFITKSAPVLVWEEKHFQDVVNKIDAL